MVRRFFAARKAREGFAMGDRLEFAGASRCQTHRTFPKSFRHPAETRPSVTGTQVFRDVTLSIFTARTFPLQCSRCPVNHCFQRVRQCMGGAIPDGMRRTGAWRGSPLAWKPRPGICRNVSVFCRGLSLPLRRQTAIFPARYPKLHSSLESPIERNRLAAHAS